MKQTWINQQDNAHSPKQVQSNTNNTQQTTQQRTGQFKTQKIVDTHRTYRNNTQHKNKTTNNKQHPT